MKEELQQITIAKACGWISHDIPDEWSSGEPSGILQWRSPLGKYADLPDYLTDLNACVEFENVLMEMGGEKCEEYLCKLDRVITGKTCWKISEVNHFLCATATAAQRCEAFLRVMDLWVDGPKGK